MHGPQHRRSSLGPAGTNLTYRPSLGRPDDTVGLGGDEGLVVEHEQHISLDELGLHRRSPDGEDGFPGKDRGTLRHCPDVAGKAEIQKVTEKLLRENTFFSEKIYVIRGKAQVLNIVDDLLQAGGDGKAAAIRDIPEKNIEVANTLV